MPSHKYNKTRKIHRKKGGSLGNHVIDDLYPNPEKRSPLKLPSIFQSLLNNTRKVNSTMQNQQLKNLQKVYIEPLQNNINKLLNTYKPKNIEINESNISNIKKEKIEKIMELINIYNNNVDFQEKNPLLKDKLQQIVSEKDELENIINTEIEQIKNLKEERQKRINQNRKTFKIFLKNRKTQKQKNIKTEKQNNNTSPTQPLSPKFINLNDYIVLIKNKPYELQFSEIEKQEIENKNKNMDKFFNNLIKLKNDELKLFKQEIENKNKKY